MSRRVAFALGVIFGAVVCPGVGAALGVAIADWSAAR